jgi:hypothetical protein
MKLVWLIVLASASAPARAAPVLPAKIPLANDADRASHERELRKRTPKIQWDTIETDAHGFIQRAVTFDPALVMAGPHASEAFARIKQILRTNADLFGIDAADVDAIAAAGNTTFGALFSGGVLGEVYIGLAGPPERHGLDLRVGCVDAGLLAGPAADKAWGNVAPRDHAFVPHGAAPKIPYVVDVVTGEVIATKHASCFEPIFGSPC